VLAPNGTPTPPFAVRMVPPSSRMGPLTDDELARRLLTPQVKRYAEAIDRESAREKLAARVAPQAPAGSGSATTSASETFDRILRSPITSRVATVVAGAITRGVMGAILGSRRR